MGEKSRDTAFLGEVLASLTNAQGVLGCIITDKEGTSLVGCLPPGINNDICESAVATLHGSCEQVIGWAHQGDLVSVLIEADSGKLLIANSSDLNIVVMAQKDVNVGLLRVSLRRAADSIETGVLGKPKEESVAPTLSVSRPELRAEIPSVQRTEVKKIKEVRPKVEEIPIPTLPDLPVNIAIPDDLCARADLEFDIYKALFLSLSIGAAKVSGVAPTRGMLKRYLPQSECSVFLDGVGIQPNATLDFKRLKENLDRLPPAERERVLKENFGKIISSLVSGYGSVMGYAPLKGMTKKEIESVMKAYGEAMRNLGIAGTIPSEIFQ
jgi:predicted regulator of Ras-like GTPase activity (Roadblock/LC7/MglB family)